MEDDENRPGCDEFPNLAPMARILIVNGVPVQIPIIAVCVYILQKKAQIERREVDLCLRANPEWN